ncbi:CoA ester lyase [Neobacillus sp. YX16]|uniref:HpcH/HpaI aldolase/citrate lyase family protein n=1 Tax=Neobacillus sp. YX16 TaxID=3047874 RepID=UPI0024C2FA18|nr:CoA ester lyase [Neobacillus sp. YX16]WHZ00821.1 CoA ester lyase [Neobacillus sp. YX16]
MKPIRSMLFVPGSKENWFNKIPEYGSDTIILDLEDSVPNNLKETARKSVAQVISPFASKNQRIYVRINRGPYGFDIEDVEAIIQPELEGIVLPKLNGPEDVDTLSSIVSEIEHKKNIKIGTTKFIATLETARSIYLAYEIGIKDRVVALAGVSPANGDVARSVGYQWTKEGLERIYIRSHVVLAARAAEIIPIGGLWQDVHDLKGLKEAATFNRQLGFAGEMIVHPSNVPVINKVYSPSEQEIDHYKRMIETFETALREGTGAVLFEGEHIDNAHLNTARQMLKFAESFKETS